MMGHRYSDSVAVSFTVSEQLYEIGTNSKIWSHVAGGYTARKFCAEEILLRATENCYVRLQRPDAPQKLIEAGVNFTFKRKITKLYIVRVTSDGTLYIDAEGDIVL